MTLAESLSPADTLRAIRSSSAGGTLKFNERNGFPPHLS